MALASLVVRHRWGFLSDRQLAAALPLAHPDDASAALPLLGLRDRISAVLSADIATRHDQQQRLPERPLLLAADAGSGVAPQLLDAFPPAWCGIETAGHSWQLARALLPAGANEARFLLAAVDAPDGLILRPRLQDILGQSISEDERLLLAAPVGGDRWLEWHLILPANDNLSLDQLLRQPLIIDWYMRGEMDDGKSDTQADGPLHGRIALDCYRDFPFLDR